MLTQMSPYLLAPTFRDGGEPSSGESFAVISDHGNELVTVGRVFTDTAGGLWYAQDPTGAVVEVKGRAVDAMGLTEIIGALFEHLDIAGTKRS